MMKKGKFIQCIQCKEYFYVNKYQVNKRKYCSQKCSAISNIGHPAPKTAFKKGHMSWNTGLHIYLGGKRFKKGQIPWNKGKHFFGKESPHWKGGIKKNNGYVMIYQSNHPFCNSQKYVLRSRLVMEKKIGRFLDPKEIVHHKGIKYPIGSIKNKQDDRKKNLQLFVNKREHTKFHHQRRCAEVQTLTAR